MKLSSNYNKYPVINIPGENRVWTGWDNILTEIQNKLSDISRVKKILVVECYQGVLDEEVEQIFRKSFENAWFINSAEAMLPEKTINEKLREDITDDEVFGYLTRYNIDCYFDSTKTENLRSQIMVSDKETIVVYGTGAAFIAP